MYDCSHRSKLQQLVHPQPQVVKAQLQQVHGHSPMWQIHPSTWGELEASADWVKWAWDQPTLWNFNSACRER